MKELKQQLVGALLVILAVAAVVAAAHRCSRSAASEVRGWDRSAGG